jgi:hypothetical protein
MQKHLRNEKGFALALILSVLPILIGAGLVALFTMNYMQMNAHHLYICRTESLKTQNQVGKNLETLLKLNPLSRELRIEKIAADVAVAAAIAAYGYGLPAARAYEQSVKVRRVALDIEQRALIIRSNALLLKTYFQTRSELNAQISKDLGMLRPFITSTFSMRFSAPTYLAVRPDKTDLAPVYETQPQFEKRMTLVHRWQYRLSVADFLGKFLKGEQEFNRDCSVTLSEKDNKWQGKIREDKSLLKSVF